MACSMQTFTIINFVYYFLARIFLAAAGIYNRAFCGGQMHAAQEVQQQYSKGSLLLPIQSMLILDIVDMLSAAQDPFRSIPVHSPPFPDRF